MKAKRILLSVIGVVITGISVGSFKLAALGIDPFQCFMSGVNQLIPISFGTLYVIVNAALLLFALVFDRHYIGIATFINLFLLGYIVQFSHDFFVSAFPAPSMLTRIFCFVGGFLFLCLGSSLYITADMGVSTYDAIALIMAHKWKMGKFKYIRICTDLVCILVGITLFLLGKGVPSAVASLVGIGTVVTALGMGPLIDVFNRTISAPILCGSKKQNA